MPRPDRDQAGRRVRIEDLEEMPDAERGGLPRNVLYASSVARSSVQVVVKRHRIEHQIAERADGGQVGRAEGREGAAV